jgi:hypothetical protein
VTREAKPTPEQAAEGGPRCLRGEVRGGDPYGRGGAPRACRPPGPPAPLARLVVRSWLQCAPSSPLVRPPHVLPYIRRTPRMVYRTDTAEEAGTVAEELRRTIDRLTTYASRAKQADQAGNTLQALADLHIAENNAREAVREAGRQARREGHTWAAIGDAYGVTRATAYERFHTDEP